MRLSIDPSTGQNISARLFFRFFLCYFVGVLIALPPALRGYMLPHGNVGLWQMLLVLLALPAAFLTLSRSYLLLLSLVKAFFDVAWLTQTLSALSHLSNTFFTFNACLLYLVFSLLLFCFAASRACLFSVSVSGRDLQLILTRAFVSFLLEALLISLLALFLYELWPQIAALYI